MKKPKPKLSKPASKKTTKEGSGVRAIRNQLAKAHDELRRVRDELEQRVEERTRSLVETNAELNAQISRREKLESELLALSEREKRSFGQDLHDETCQGIAGLSLIAETIARELGESHPEMRRKAALLHELSLKLLDETRRIARGLHPAVLNDGLSAALEDLAARARVRMPCEFRGDKSIETSEMEALTIYRIAQEAVTNSLRHARASQLRILFRPTSEGLILSVEDDGVGIPNPVPTGPGMGLDIMGYRALTIGAQLVIERLPQGGTRVVCALPVRATVKSRRRQR